VLDYYSDANAPLATKKDRKRWAKVLREVDELKAYNPAEASPAIKASALTITQN
jgi:hypothetical protein